MIKAIETRYAGCHFRSRLEARWAVFFDALKIRWEYEPEGFETSVGWYLPDFRIQVPDDSYPYWFEVKPETARPDDRHRALCVETATPFILACGMPRDYHDQLRGSKSALTALLWGDRLDGARYPAGETQPRAYPCAFVGRADRHMGSNSDEGHWDAIHKARSFGCSTFEDTHIALYTENTGYHGPRLGLIPREHHHGHRTPDWSEDVDAAYAAARSARFEHGQSASYPKGPTAPAAQTYKPVLGAPYPTREQLVDMVAQTLADPSFAPQMAQNLRLYVNVGFLQLDQAEAIIRQRATKMPPLSCDPEALVRVLRGVE